MTRFRPQLDWYRGRRVFLTGHTGFKGAWLSLWLHRLGAEATGYALPAERPSLFDDACVGDLVAASHLHDIADRDALSAALEAARPEVVIHMAAQSLVRLSYAAPVETFATNVMGTANLLDACRNLDGLSAVLVITSDKCYENDGSGRPFTENDAMGGSDPYSASKGCAELVTASFQRSYFEDAGISLVSARAGNVIGGGDWSQDRLIPDLIRATQAGEPALVRNPEFSRPWQHVLEPLSGYLQLAQQAATSDRPWSGGWNFGPAQDDTVSVRTLVNLALGELPDLTVRLAKQSEGPHEAGLLSLDSGKSRQTLGWHPHLNVREAVQLTLEYYRATLFEGADPRATALDQLTRYEQRACEE